MVIIQMDDPTVTFLKSEIAKSEAHTKKLRNTLATYLGESEPKQTEFATVETSGGDLSGYSQVQAVYRVLADSTSPLTYAEIIRLAKNRGKDLTATSLPSLLSRDKKKFSHAGEGRWTIAALS